MVLVAFVQPLLVLALELVVEGDPLDVGAALHQTRLCLLIRAIDLKVVFHFPLAFEARVERLVVLLVGVPMPLQQAAALLREHDRMVAMAGHADGLDQPLLSKMSEVARPWIGRAIVVVPEITTGDHSKRADGRERARLGSA